MKGAFQSWLCAPSPPHNHQRQQRNQETSPGEGSCWLPWSRPGARQLQLGVQPAGQALGGLANERVVVPGEPRPGDRRGQVHPSPGGPHVPVVGDQRPAVVGGEGPTSHALQLPGGDGLQAGGWLEVAHLDVEAEPVGSRVVNSRCWRFPSPSASPGSSSSTRWTYFHQLGQRSVWRIYSQTCWMGAWRRQVLTR